MIHSRSIRFRLTLWYSLVLTFGMVLFGGFLVLAMRHQLYSEVDLGLRKRTEALDSFLREQESEGFPHLHDEIAEFSQALPSEYSIAVLDSQGKAIFMSDESADLFQIISSSENNRCEFLRARGKDYRVIDHHAKLSNSEMRLLLADCVEGVEGVLRQLSLLLFAAIPGVVVAAAFGGYLLSARALAPVDAMTRDARLIGVENLSNRLVVPDTDDEIERLATTWNEMLARLDTAVTRISQFTSDASHELRTPIAIIRATAEIALRRERSETDYRRSLQRIEIESERMTQLLEDLLFLARSEAPAVLAKMAPVDLRTIVADVCTEIEPLAAKKGVSLRSTLCEGDLALIGREPALRRLVLVLLDNALKYTLEGGTIEVRAQCRQQNVVLSVHDSGIGIPEDALPHIFERFFRADASRSRESGGYGLGLAIAQTIARQHSGFIVAESVINAGSEFRVVLPAANRVLV